ncbi:uncharacterized protein LY79DRAFT_663581 [Colletotrichum navitas]|uniref:Uncharacterized protein n=1 Tax=Colletotrichum navitas TaxID=681940 RepID=A0AAD8UWL3_9PEZI|nr:uncharacterized protein LY79DRAFT_663581 [Colletotrichum navitas]KAK1569610.1 hypothetical protein LY79DRAFT_663581 [Colletotrichum navitas]
MPVVFSHHTSLLPAPKRNRQNRDQLSLEYMGGGLSCPSRLLGLRNRAGSVEEGNGGGNSQHHANIAGGPAGLRRLVTPHAAEKESLVDRFSFLGRQDPRHPAESESPSRSGTRLVWPSTDQPQCQPPFCWHIYPGPMVEEAEAPHPGHES